MYTTGALRAGGTGDVGAVGGGGDDEGSVTSGPRSDSDSIYSRVVTCAVCPLVAFTNSKICMPTGFNGLLEGET